MSSSAASAAEIHKSTADASSSLPRAGASAVFGPPPRPAVFPPSDGGAVRVDFRGWPSTPRMWGRWVEKLRPRHEQAWRDLGILDGILATVDCGRVRRDERLLLLLAGFWSAAKGSFVFPWGEATVTLEDVAVLAGLPVVGVPVSEEVIATLAADVSALEVARVVMNRGKCRKPVYSAWIRHFLERSPGAGDVVEHGAFLAMWLSLYVLPAPPSNVVRAQVFPTAVLLARGQSVSLAPAVLAAIYNDLTALSYHLAVSGRVGNHLPLACWAPLQTLQLWVWEHFPALSPPTAFAGGIQGGVAAPRAARWRSARKVFDPAHIRAALMTPGAFLRRPYGSTSGFASPPEANGQGFEVKQEKV
uniref:Aminotransferase-like plant mobile domain-containing protein n=1 Tax=Leersia perrieri TaxID=77586 RepID=A0A0D9XY95_9ORYZ